MANTHLSPEEEAQLVNADYQDLLNGYLASNHRKKVEIIEKAFRFACDAHKGVYRRSGEPYITHPIAVARIVSREIGLGSTSICSALLHDVVEDTDYTVDDIRQLFGDKIATIVEGLTKISGGIFGEKASAQAENFRKLLLTMNNDIRVVLIKMADRLHNMRTLGSMLPSKQYKIAGETLYIYAPLAHRLGLFAIKTELEDLSFKYEHPDVYAQIRKQIAASEEERNRIFNEFSAPIAERLTNLGLEFDIKARLKSAYSIWKKMEAKQIPFSEVYDLYAARIVFKCPNEADEKRLCWTIYSEITDLYKLHPDRIRDWINTPKANGYRALHITVMGPDGKWVEVQIRSERMDEIAERGFAAHWKYKIGQGEGEEESELTSWLATIQDILKNPEPNALDFLDTVKLNLFASEIVVFTPKGDVVTLPNGASVLDLAFYLHTELGIHCIAGKVNHKLVPLSHKLNSGDQVEVLTSQSQQPMPEWDAFLSTAKAKTRLQQALRKDKRHIQNAGRKKLIAWLEANGITYTNDVIMRLVSRYHVSGPDEFLFLGGDDEIELDQNVLDRLKAGSPRSKNPKELFSKLIRTVTKTGSSITSSQKTPSVIKFVGKIDPKQEYILKSEDGVSNYMLAPCCNPIPGDDVVGFVNNDNIVEIHKLVCSHVMKLKSSFGNRLLQTRWADPDAKFVATIDVSGIDRMGILQELAAEITTTMAIDVRRLNIAANDGLFTAEVDVMVEDANVVTNLCRRLKKIRGVKLASRRVN